MPPPNNNLSNGRDGPVNRWHRNSGIVAAAGLLYLLATGLPLQFSAQLALGQRFVTSDWVLDWYGLQAPERVIRSGEAVHVGGLLFLRGAPLGQLDGFAGALSTDTTTVAAGGKQLFLVHNAAPDQPETISMNSSIMRLGQRDGAVFLDTQDGLLAADPAMLNWQPSAVPAEAIQWAIVTNLGESDAQRYRAAFRARMLTLQRWFQDLHSGRFFGPVGLIIIDAVSMLLVLLAATGLILWIRYARGSKRNRNDP